MRWFWRESNNVAYDISFTATLTHGKILSSQHTAAWTMTMTAVSLAIVSNRNEPVYIKEFFHEAPSAGDDLPFEEELFGLPAPFENTEESSALPKRTECSLRQQFILHAALDRFEQLDGPPPGYAWRKQGVASGADAMFLGLLCPVEDMRVYGKVHGCGCGWHLSNVRRASTRTLWRSRRMDMQNGLTPRDQ